MVYVAFHRVTKYKEPEQIKKQINIKLFFLDNPKQHQIFLVMPCHFKYLFHEMLLPGFSGLHNGRLRAEPRLGSRVSSASVWGVGVLDWQVKTEQRQSRAPHATHSYSHVCLSVSSILSKGDPLTLSTVFVLRFTRAMLSARPRGYNGCKVLGRKTLDKCKQYADRKSSQMKKIHTRV